MEDRMKFVTVMDMWLLIVNIGLVGCLIYVVRQMTVLFKEFQGFKNMEIIDKELKSIISIVKEERDNNTALAVDDLGFYDDLIERLEQRRSKNIIAGTTPID
jgi:hypothetical protein